jgi:hypothetical protein
MVLSFHPGKRVIIRAAPDDRMGLPASVADEIRRLRHLFSGQLTIGRQQRLDGAVIDEFLRLLIKIMPR